MNKRVKVSQHDFYMCLESMQKRKTVKLNGKAYEVLEGVIDQSDYFIVFRRKNFLSKFFKNKFLNIRGKK